MTLQKQHFNDKGYCLFGFGDSGVKLGDYVLCVKSRERVNPWFTTGKLYEVRGYGNILRLECERGINASANHGAKFAPLSPAMKIMWGIK